MVTGDGRAGARLGAAAWLRGAVGTLAREGELRSRRGVRDSDGVLGDGAGSPRYLAHARRPPASPGRAGVARVRGAGPGHRASTHGRASRPARRGLPGVSLGPCAPLSPPRASRPRARARRRPARPGSESGSAGDRRWDRGCSGTLSSARYRREPPWRVQRLVQVPARTDLTRPRGAGGTYLRTAVTTHPAGTRRAARRAASTGGRRRRRLPSSRPDYKAAGVANVGVRGPEPRPTRRAANVPRSVAQARLRAGYKTKPPGLAPPPRPHPQKGQTAGRRRTGDPARTQRRLGHAGTDDRPGGRPQGRMPVAPPAPPPPGRRVDHGRGARPGTRTVPPRC